MKKLLLTMLGCALAAISYGQGGFVFSGNAGSVWDDWSSAVAKRDNTNYVAFLIGSGTPLVASTISASTPTNIVGVDAAAAWTAILGDPNYLLATNDATGALVVGNTTVFGGVFYGSGSFTVRGTNPSGGTTSVFVIGWSKLYGPDPVAAAAAGAPIGWSAVFTYNYAAGPVPGPPGPPPDMNGQYQFGVQPDSGP